MKKRKPHTSVAKVIITERTDGKIEVQVILDEQPHSVLKYVADPPCAGAEIGGFVVGAMGFGHTV